MHLCCSSTGGLLCCIGQIDWSSTNKQKDKHVFHIELVGHIEQIDWSSKDKQKSQKNVFHKLSLLLQDINQDGKIATINNESELLN